MNFKNPYVLHGILYIDYKGTSQEIGQQISLKTDNDRVFHIDQTKLKLNAMDTMDLDKILKNNFGDTTRIIFI